MNRINKKWTQIESELLKKHFNMPNGMSHLTCILNRSKQSVFQQAKRLKIFNPNIEKQQ